MKFARLLVAVGMMTIAMPARSQSTDCVCPKGRTDRFQGLCRPDSYAGPTRRRWEIRLGQSEHLQVPTRLGTEKGLHRHRSVALRSVGDFRAGAGRDGASRPAPGGCAELLSLGAQEPNLQRFLHHRAGRGGRGL